TGTTRWRRGHHRHDAVTGCDKEWSRPRGRLRRDPSRHRTACGGAPTGADPETLRLDNAAALGQVPDDIAADPIQELFHRCGQDDAESCAAILDALSGECYDGYGLSCDLLYQL